MRFLMRLSLEVNYVAKKLPIRTEIMQPVILLCQWPSISCFILKLHYYILKHWIMYVIWDYAAHDTFWQWPSISHFILKLHYYILKHWIRYVIWNYAAHDTCLAVAFYLLLHIKIALVHFEALNRVCKFKNFMFTLYPLEIQP